MSTDAAITVIAALVGIGLVVGMHLLRPERPRRTLSNPLGDATERRARLRLVMGGRR